MAREPHHGTEEIPPPPKKSCLDKARNAIARIASQICTEHWRTATYLKRIRKRADDKCWFCSGSVSARMTRSDVLLHCPNEWLRSDRVGGRGRAWDVLGCC
jgi:hypothetical protein